MADWDDEDVSVAMSSNEVFNAGNEGGDDNYGDEDEDWGPTASMVNTKPTVVANDEDWGVESGGGGGGGGNNGYNRRDGGGGSNGYNRRGGDGGGGGNSYNRQRKDERGDDVNTLLLLINNQVRRNTLIPDNYDESTVEEFLSKLNFSDYYTSPSAMNRLIVYLISALKFHTKKEQDLIKQKMKATAAATRPIQMPRSEEINDLLNTSNNDEEEGNAFNLLERLRSSFIDSNLGSSVNNSLLQNIIQENISSGSVDGAVGGGSGGVGSIGLPISQRIIDTLERMPELPELSMDSASVIIPDLPEDLFTANLSNIQTTTTTKKSALLQRPRMITSTRKRKEPTEGAVAEGTVAERAVAAGQGAAQELETSAYIAAATANIRRDQSIRNRHYNERLIRLAEPMQMRKLEEIKPLPTIPDNLEFKDDRSTIIALVMSHGLWARAANPSNILPDTSFALRLPRAADRHVVVSSSSSTTTSSSSSSSSSEYRQHQQKQSHCRHRQQQQRSGGAVSLIIEQLQQQEEQNIPQQLRDAAAATTTTSVTSLIRNDMTPMTTAFSDFLSSINEVNMPAINSADHIVAPPIVTMSHSGDSQNVASDMSNTFVPMLITAIGGSDGGGGGIASGGQASTETSNSLPVVDISSLGGASAASSSNTTPAMVVLTPLNARHSSLGAVDSSGSRSVIPMSFLQRQNLTSIREVDAEYRRTFENQRQTISSTPLVLTQQVICGGFDENESCVNPRRILSSTAEQNNECDVDVPAVVDPLTVDMLCPGTEIPISAMELLNDGAEQSQLPLMDAGNGENILPPLENDEYRRDWFNILRKRHLLGNVSYVNESGGGGSPRKRSRRQRRRRHRSQSPAGRQQQQDNVAAPQNEAEQMLAAIIPPPEEQPLLEQLQQITAMTESHPTLVDQQQLDLIQMPLIDEEPLLPPVIPGNSLSDEMLSSTSYQQQKHDEFILQNQEEISTIMDMDNLPLVRMLVEHNHALIEVEKQNRTQQQTADERHQPKCYPTLPATYTYDPDLILKEDPTKLRIKISVLNALVSQRQVDLKRTDFIRNRYEGAIAFGFLLELKAIKVITLSREGGERRGGYNRDGDGGGDNDDGTEKKREFYIPPEPTNDETEVFNTGITSGINFSKYENIAVNVSGENVPKAIKNFTETDLREIILDNVKKSGYVVPTPIQKVAIPVISAGRDLMACAQTGSGKTAAFLLPILSGILSEGKDLEIGKPHAIVVSPTRELAIQIYNEARKFAYTSYVKISIVYGGTSFKYQNENVAKGCHLLICTPGRLLDFVNRAFITFDDTRYVVLDEADRMLDMGFVDSIKNIMSHQTMCNEHQTLMFSATFPEEIQRLAGEFLNDYVFVAIGVVGGACSDVKQQVLEVNKFNKRAKLLEILREDADGTIVFVETKRGADFLASFFSETEFPTTSIHGDRLQSQRETALREFKAGTMKVLIATSVASRGLDIKNVNHVINFDMPQSIDDYVHRIGRTGRVGNNGRATSFFDPEYDRAIAEDLVKILEDAEQEVPDFLRELGGEFGAGESCGNGNFGGFDVRGKQNVGALEANLDWDD